MATMVPSATPTAKLSTLTDSVTPSARKRKIQLCDRTARRAVMLVPSGGAPERRSGNRCALPATASLLQNAQLLGGHLVLDLSVDRRQPFEEFRLVLVDRHPDIGGEFTFRQALIAFGEADQTGQL